MVTSAREPWDATRIGVRLDLAAVHAVACRDRAVALDDDARVGLERMRGMLEGEIAAGRTIYGVNTGLGGLCETRVPEKKLRLLQQNLLRSHAVGLGPELDRVVVRALLLLRAHTLALGASGVSVAVVEQLVAFLNRDVTPCVPEKGSVGASGDLAPLAHLALPLIGEGFARVGGERMPGQAALERAGLEPLALGPKEGLSLINGTQLITAVGALAAHDAGELLVAADIVGALSLDAHLGSARICDERIHAGKPHAGQRASASLIASLIAGSRLNASHSNCGRVQDAYSFRCMPQVHGAVRDAHRYVCDALAIEMNSLTDNPLVFDDEAGGFDVISGGNFHGANVALPLDHLCAALTTLASISERRTAQHTSAALSRGLPPFLASDPGVESGLMMPHVTASALVSECKSKSFPASVDSIPTSAGQEDHVSMGPIAARKLREVVADVARVLAIEAAVAARALDLREEHTSEVLERAHAEIRVHCAPLDGDRAMGDELEALASAIRAGALRRATGCVADGAVP